MSQPRVSVVLSVYNGDAYLLGALDSVLQQSFTDLELIAVDDGSTDNTPSILAEAAAQDPRVVVLTNPENRGLTPSLNHGLRAARGTLIARQDADDLSAPERLAHQVAFLDREPEVCLLGTAYHEIDAEGRPLATRYPPETDTGIRAQMLFHNALCHSAVMLRRSALQRVGGGYDERLAYSQDVALWAQLLDQGQGANLSIPLVSLRKHEATVSAQNSTAQQRLATDVAKQQIQRLLPNAILSDSDVAALRDWYGGLPLDADPDRLSLCNLYFDLLDHLARRTGMDRAALDGQRRHHIRRLLGRATTRQLLGLLRAGVVGRMLRADPLVTALTASARLSRRAQTLLGMPGGRP